MTDTKDTGLVDWAYHHGARDGRNWEYTLPNHTTNREADAYEAGFAFGGMGGFKRYVLPNVLAALMEVRT